MVLGSDVQHREVLDSLNGFLPVLSQPTARSSRAYSHILWRQQSATDRQYPEVFFAQLKRLPSAQVRRCKFYDWSLSVGRHPCPVCCPESRSVQGRRENGDRDSRAMFCKNHHRRSFSCALLFAPIALFAIQAYAHIHLVVFFSSHRRAAGSRLRCIGNDVLLVLSYPRLEWTHPIR